MTLYLSFSVSIGIIYLGINTAIGRSVTMLPAADDDNTVTVQSPHIVTVQRNDWWNVWFAVASSPLKCVSISQHCYHYVEND